MLISFWPRNLVFGRKKNLQKWVNLVFEWILQILDVDIWKALGLLTTINSWCINNENCLMHLPDCLAHPQNCWRCAKQSGGALNNLGNALNNFGYLCTVHKHGLCTITCAKNLVHDLHLEATLPRCGNRYEVRHL
jgi:hypothetical protein